MLYSLSNGKTTSWNSFIINTKNGKLIPLVSRSKLSISSQLC
ncbi:hypothetical protein Gotur_007315 [Gossypium turneri]